MSKRTINAAYGCSRAEEDKIVLQVHRSKETITLRLKLDDYNLSYLVENLIQLAGRRRKKYLERIAYLERMTAEASKTLKEPEA